MFLKINDLQIILEHHCEKKLVAYYNYSVPTKNIGCILELAILLLFMYLLPLCVNYNTQKNQVTLLFGSKTQTLMNGPTTQHCVIKHGQALLAVMSASVTPDINWLIRGIMKVRFSSAN